MDNLERLKDNDFNVHSSMVSLAMEQTRILSTILDVLIETHLNGKDEEEGKKFIDFVNKRLDINLNHAAGMLILHKPDNQSQS